MNSVRIYRQIPVRHDPRLGRVVNFDSRARLFRYNTLGLKIETVKWDRQIPVFNQGQTGKCTAEAATGCVGTNPYYNSDIVAAYCAAFGSFDDTGTDRFYSAEETLDGDGPFPPNDNGSSGLTAAKVLQAAKVITGYEQTFSLTDNLKALSQQPVIIGIPWFNSMFEPNTDGKLLVDPSSGLAGYHEVIESAYDLATDLVEITNSWGEEWGKGGRCYVTSQELNTLLQVNGDTTIFSLPGTPAPVPGVFPSSHTRDTVTIWANGLMDFVQAWSWNVHVADWIEAQTDTTVDGAAYWYPEGLLGLGHSQHVQHFMDMTRAEAVDHKKVVLIGHSNGSRIAAEGLLMNPDIHVDTLILIAAWLPDDCDKNGINKLLARRQVDRVILLVSAGDNTLNLNHLSPFTSDYQLGRDGPINTLVTPQVVPLSRLGTELLVSTFIVVECDTSPLYDHCDWVDARPGTSDPGFNADTIQKLLAVIG